MFKIFKEDFLDLNEIQRLITNDKLPITNKERLGVRSGHR